MNFEGRSVSFAKFFLRLLASQVRNLRELVKGEVRRMLLPKPYEKPLELFWVHRFAIRPKFSHGFSRTARQASAGAVVATDPVHVGQRRLPQRHCSLAYTSTR